MAAGASNMTVDRHTIQHPHPLAPRKMAYMVEEQEGKELLGGSHSSSARRYFSDFRSSGNSPQPPFSMAVASESWDPPPLLTKQSQVLPPCTSSKGAIPDPSACSSRQKNCSSRIPWSWTRVRTGIMRRKEPVVEDSMKSGQCTHGLGLVHGRPTATAMQQDSTGEDRLVYSEAADYPREDPKEAVAGGSIFEEASPNSSYKQRHAADRGPRKVQRHCHTRRSQQRSDRTYQPKTFEEIVGQEMVVKTLYNAIQMRRISPLYLFHGPGGIGKTSAANVFSMALNCETASPSKPCWACMGCSLSVCTADLCYGTRNSGFGKIRTMLESTTFMQAFSGLKVFILDECHYLSPDSWAELLDMEENGHGALVFIMITEDMGMVPRAVSSRCQRFSFQRLKEADVALKLARIVAQEGIEIRMEALLLIAKKAEGNLREAQNLLDQLALLGQAITPPMVQQLVGLVPHDKLICLLEAAMSGDSIEALRCTRDLIACGVESHSLISQLVSCITEVLVVTASSLSAPTQDERSMHCHVLLRKHHHEKLCHILGTLIDTEKQMISSHNHTTLVIAVMLQITSDSSHRLSTGIIMPENKSLVDKKSDTASRLYSTDGANEAQTSNDRIHSSEVSHHQSCDHILDTQSHSAGCLNKSIKNTNIEEVWHNMLERIHNESVRDFLHSQVKLASLTLSRANAIVHLMIKHAKDKPAIELTEEYLSTALGDALGCPVVVNMSHEPTQIEVRTTKCAINNEKQAAEPSHSAQQLTRILPAFKASESLDCRGYLLRRASSDKASRVMDSVPMFARIRNSKHTDVHRCDHMTTSHRDNMTQNQQIPLSGHLSRNSIDGSLKNYMNHSGREQLFDSAFITRATDLKHKLLSISLIPQTDASVEPYSQDLLFEEANLERRQGARNSELRKDSSKSKQHSLSMAYTGLNHSWSCTERFCRGHTT